MARAKKKEDKNALYYAALYSKHSELYEMAYEDSKKVVNSVLDSIKQLLKECEVLSLPDFGKFENHERKSYQMVDNFPGSDGKKRIVPTKHTVRFTAFPKLNEASDQFYATMQEAEGGEG